MADDTPDLKRIVKVARDFSRPYRVDDGRRFRLKDFPAGDTAHLESEDKPRAQEALADRPRRRSPSCRTCSTRRTAGRCCSIFQAMDAAGKDGAIKHVMSGVNPQGCQVFSFKAPVGGGTRPRLPVALHEGPAGARPHRHLQPQLLRGSAGRAGAPGVPRGAEAAAAARRQEHLEASATRTSARSSATSARNGVLIRKFFLHVSRDGAEEALPRAPRRARRRTGSSRPADVKERGHWDALHGRLRGR